MSPKFNKTKCQKLASLYKKGRSLESLKKTFRCALGTARKAVTRGGGRIRRRGRPSTKK